MKHLFSIIIIAVLLAASCRKEVPVTPPPIPIDKTKPTLLWKERLRENSGFSSFDPQVYGNEVLFGCLECPNQPFLVLDGATGKTNASIEGWPDVWEDFGRREYSFKYGDNFVHAYRRMWTSVDVPNRKINWVMQKPNPTYNQMTYTNGEYAYWSDEYQFTNNGQASKSCIFRTSYNHLQVDTIIDMEFNNGYSPFFWGFGFEKLSNGDEVIIVKNRSHNPTLPWQTAERMDVFAYNITADTMLWYHTGVEVNNWGGTLPIRTYQGKAIVPGHNYIHCFDIATGAKLWEFEVHESLVRGDVIMHNSNVLYMDHNEGRLTSINLNTANRNWRRQNLGGCSGRMVLYNDKLFYCGGDLFVVDANNGSLLYSSKGMSLEWGIGSPPFTCTPALDTVNRRVFMNNSMNAVGLQMAEDW